MSKTIKVLSKEESQALLKKIKKTKTTAVVIKIKVKIVQSQAEKDRASKERYRKEKLKEIADSYKFDDRTGHIKSVKNSII